MSKDNCITQRYCHGYSHITRKHRSKTDWSGIGIGDAFKRNLDYYLRLSAQKMFYRVMKKAQMKVAKITGGSSDTEMQPLIKPQISPCYSTYPSVLASYAAIGLTAFLEFKARMKQNILFTYMKSYLDNPAEADSVNVDPEVYKKISSVVTKWVETRLLIEDLSRYNSLASVEIYRLFCTSQETLKFSSLPEIIRAVILYGDLLPDWDEVDIHPTTMSILKNLSDKCSSYFQEINTLKGEHFMPLGERWIRSICKALAPYLPPPEDKEDDVKNNETGKEPEYGEQINRFSHEKKCDTKRIAPLDGPNTPYLLEPENETQRILNTVMRQGLHESNRSANKDNTVSEADQALLDFAKAVENAGGQKRTWEDMRSDVLENSIRVAPFHNGPIEGNPADGHEVDVKMGDGTKMSGEIFDLAAELSENLPEYEKLLKESEAFTEALKKSLYPNIQQIPEIQRLRTSGSIDPARFSVADFSSAIFKRYRMKDQADRRGKPVLVIACDGSASLNSAQMRMVKVLAAGWLSSTAKSDIQVLAGLYHSGQIRQGVSGTLVRWIYHPQKTPAASSSEAVKTIVSFPDNGTGVQADALSIAFIMEEAKRLARGNMIYMSLISDTAWNKSFNTEKSGKEEVYLYFKAMYEDLPGKLHTTLVALGVSKETGFEDLLDAVILVSNEELRDYATVAEKIGMYVAQCIRERNKFISR
jgi:hypothetical protein